MIAEDLIARLEKVRKSDERSWTARCPAHADTSPSLRVTDADGKILLHCFAGCEPHAICSALGLSLSDLFPPRTPLEEAQYRRERFSRGTLKDMQHELSVALIILDDLLEKREVSARDAERAKRARATLARLARELSAAQSSCR